jgi:hypothetical protein
LHTSDILCTDATTGIHFHSISTSSFFHQRTGSLKALQLNAQQQETKYKDGAVRFVVKVTLQKLV